MMRSSTHRQDATVGSKKAALALAAAGIAAALAAAPANAQFAYNNFGSVSGLNMVGTSLRDNDTLILTPALTRVSGAAWYSTKQAVATGFDTTIQFRISNVLGTGADGLAFVIQNSNASAIGGNGGAIGYGDNPRFGGVGISNSLAVEFDTWNNSPADWADLDGNHVSIQSRGLLPNSPAQQYSLGAAHVPTDMSDGQIHTAVIDYIPGLMRIYVDDLSTPLVSANVNLSTLLSLDAGAAWVGITSATGGATDIETHEVTSWRFQNAVPTPGALPLLGGLGLLAARRRRPAAASTR